MKRGIIRIVIGLILIVLQIISVAGNQMNGTVTFSPPVSSAQLLFDLGFYSAYYSVGIIGLILLISGLFAFFDIHIFSKKEKKVKVAKQRFCKYCGQPIDQTTKKCSGCGKQYFRIPTISKSTVALCIVVLVSVASIAFCLHQIDNLNKQIVDRNAEIDYLEYQVSVKDDTIMEKNTQLRELQAFVNQYAVFIFDYDIGNNGQYHKYNCVLIENTTSSFAPFLPKYAESAGYTPCQLCH